MALSSSSSSSSVQHKYEVFLSFRGEDTRTNFTSHLHAALERKGIRSFVDYRLERGEEISPALLTTIEESKISIIVLSEHYASSSWCLDELCKIFECKERNGQKVASIFYHVDPSDVRNQKGSFAEAFAKHQEHFKDRADKVEKWRAALVEVGSLSGWHIQGDRLEAELVEDIAKFIWVNLYHELSSDVEVIVGMDSRIDELEKLLDHMESVGVRILGIWGVPGVGKTTTAHSLFKRLSGQFDASYFLADVREKSKRQGLECLRNELFSETFKEKFNLGTFIIDWLHCRKVLLVLDDVNNSQQVEYLIGDRSHFGPGSTIFITGRDEKVLQPIADKIYEVQKLTYDQALELFTQIAFRGKHSKEKYLRLSIRVVRYADGIPLALKILGSSLYGKSERTWENALGRLEKAPNNVIHDVLRISFDGLEDEEKQLFLDVACFFNGEDRNHVTNILNGCGFSTDIGISVLVDKSLITISNNKLQMHDLIQEFGREIVRQESIHLGERSRIWNNNDIDDILTTNKGTNKVEGIFLNMSEIEEPICINPEAFLRMCNLRLLKFYNSHSQGDLKGLLLADGILGLSADLVYLYWDCCPLESLPLKFRPKNLVDLHMAYSHVIRLWEGTLNLQKLKWIDLSYSQCLKELPDLSKAPNLARIYLVGCIWLESVSVLPPNLQYLDAHNCKSLKANSSSFPIGHGWGQRFIFTNCIELDQNAIWAKTQLSIQQRATADVKLYHKDKKQDLKPSICICFPGSEIPEWFNCQNLGSCVTTMLPPRLHDHKLVGFAVCTVVAFEVYNKHLGFSIKCQCNFKTKCDNCLDSLSCLSFWDKSDIPRFIDSDHVFLGYDFNLYSDWYSGESKYHLNEASFEFSACDSDSGNQLDSSVFKKCGVCLLYANDDLSEIEIVGESESKSDAEECNPLMIQPRSPHNPHYLK